MNASQVTGDLELFRAAVVGILSRPRVEAANEMVDGGFLDVLATDPQLALSLLFEEQGATLSTTPALDLVALSALGESVDASTAFVHPWRWRAGNELAPAGVGSRSGIEVHGLLLGGYHRASELFVVVEGPSGRWRSVRTEIGSLEARVLPSFDASMGLAAVSGLVRGLSADLDPTAWQSTLAVSRTALAYELVGVSHRLLAVAVDHVNARRQFGRPLATNQAVRHRLADAFVALSAAESALDALGGRVDPALATVAKALAGRGAGRTIAAAIQVGGAIGLTREHELHRYVRRATVLDNLLGSASQLIPAIGRELRSSVEVPALFGLNPPPRLDI